jgi:LuxR family transcriptional regulator, maltose regulon positive regulatory protein
MTYASVLPLAERRPRRSRVHTRTLRRERLLRRLAQATEVPLTLLVAPAGYGKTTLLEHWLEQDPRQVAWLTVDEPDDDPDHLAASIALALGDGAAAGTLVELADAVERRADEFVLVVDDLHRLSTPEALGVVMAIADAVPAGSQVVAAGRREPDLPVGRLRAQGRMIDLRVRDLVMTRREAAAMLSVSGLDLAPEDVRVLHERTAGWPAGLYLAALSLRGVPDVHRAVGHFGGDDRLVADYVRDELLAPLDGEQTLFLEQISVLDELSGPLCDAVLQRHGSGRVLRDLSRSNVLVIPLDDADGSYRCHPLLADMLLAELRRARPRGEAALHRRASDWYARTGDLDRAIGHAIDAGDVERAGDLLWATAAARVLGGRGADVDGLLERFTSEELAAHPALALTAAARHLATG